MVNYPTSLDDNDSLFLAGNNLRTTLTSNIDDTTLTIPVVTTSGFPSTGFVSILTGTDIRDTEAIKYSSTTATQFNATARGADGTIAVEHRNNDNVDFTIVAAHHNEIKDAVIALEQTLGTEGENFVFQDPFGDVVISGALTVTGTSSFISGTFSESLTISGEPVSTGTGTGGGGTALTVKEADGSPSVSNVDTIVVTNGTLTDEGSGIVSIDTGGSGATISGVGFHLVTEVEGEASTITLSGIPAGADFLQIRIKLKDNQTVGSSTTGLLQFNDDTGSVYDAVFYLSNPAGSDIPSGASGRNRDSLPVCLITRSGTVSEQEQFGRAIVNVYDYDSSSDFKSIAIQGFIKNEDTDDFMWLTYGGGQWRSTDPITSLTLQKGEPSFNFITGSKVEVFGITTSGGGGGGGGAADTLQDAYDNGDGIITTTALKPVVISGTEADGNVDFKVVGSGLFTEALQVGETSTVIDDHSITTASGIFDSLTVGGTPVTATSSGTTISGWTGYTPTFNSGFTEGTGGSVQNRFFFAPSGPNEIVIQGSITLGSSGASMGSGSFTFSMPSGFTIDGSKSTGLSSGSGSNHGIVRVREAGIPNEGHGWVSRNGLAEEFVLFVRRKSSDFGVVSANVPFTFGNTSSIRLWNVFVPVNEDVDFATTGVGGTGLSATRSFFTAPTSGASPTVENTVVISGGLIQSWSQV